MPRKKVVEEEPKTNGIEEHPEDYFRTASVTVNLSVADVLGRPVEADEEKELFLAIISSFFSSEPVYNQLKQFVRFNMNNELPTPDIIVPDRHLILP